MSTVSAGISAVATSVRSLSLASSKEAGLLIFSSKSFEDNSVLSSFVCLLMICVHPIHPRASVAPQRATAAAAYGDDDHRVLGWIISRGCLGLRLFEPFVLTFFLEGMLILPSIAGHA